MRFIDLEDLDYADARLVKALADLAVAKKAVLEESDPKLRADLIEANRKKWVALRPFLSALSHDKCWYIECLNPGTDDDVDHYRPKLEVEEAPDHPGYYWKAFDLDNFRLACHRANRPRTDPRTGETGGKAAHFPLLDPAARAYSPADNLNVEKPGIFDPTDPGDPRFISFAPSGEAFLTPSYSGSPDAQRRFEDSRRYLHLNWPDFVEERLVLYNLIARNVARGEREAPDPRSTETASEAFKNAIRDLRRMIRPTALYSAAAFNYIETFQYHWWVSQCVLGRKLTNVEPAS
jgi:hypothetical protein